MMIDLLNLSQEEWPRTKRQEIICEILKSGKSVIQIAKEKGISKTDLYRNGFYSLSTYRNLKKQLRRWCREYCRTDLVGW